MLLRKKVLLIILLIYVAYFLLPLESYSYPKNIIIDPGHSPKKSGAISCTGLKEYIYNDNLVDYLFKEAEGYGLILKKTRSRNENISLLDRVKNTDNDDLFISIHHDSVQPQFIEKINSNPTSYKDKSYSIFISKKNIYPEESLRYAKLIGQYLYDNGLRPSKHHGEKIKGENREVIDEKLGIYYFDDLIVLKNARCPAMLLEAGVIVNPDDEKLVNTNEFKEIVSKAIINSITKGDMR